MSKKKRERANIGNIFILERKKKSSYPLKDLNKKNLRSYTKVNPVRRIDINLWDRTALSFQYSSGIIFLAVILLIVALVNIRLIIGYSYFIIYISLVLMFGNMGIELNIFRASVYILLVAYLLSKIKGVVGQDKLKQAREITPKLRNATEKKLLKYLEVNKGSAFTAKALLKRVEETINHPSFKKFAMRNGEKILNSMVIDGKIQSARKNDDSHYFVRLEI